MAAQARLPYIALCCENIHTSLYKTYIYTYFFWGLGSLIDIVCMHISGRIATAFFFGIPSELRFLGEVVCGTCSFPKYIKFRGMTWVDMTICGDWHFFCSCF